METWFLCEFKVQYLKRKNIFNTFKQRTKLLQREAGGVSSFHLH